MRIVDSLLFAPKSYCKKSAGSGRLSLFRLLAFVSLIAFIAGTASSQSAGVTVHSGSRTITVGPGEPGAGSRKITGEDFVRQLLGAHNDVRGNLGLPPLQWSKELAAYSEKWAKKLLADNSIAHNSKSPYGENILVTGLGSTPASVVSEWASESGYYTYSTNSCDGDCGHYTQLVWRATLRVGCAMAHNKQREIWVCSYDPAGNFLGERPY